MTVDEIIHKANKNPNRMRIIESGAEPKPVYMYSHDGVFIRSFESHDAASKFFDVTPGCVSQWVKKGDESNEKFNGYHVLKGSKK